MSIVLRLRFCTVTVITALLMSALWTPTVSLGAAPEQKVELPAVQILKTPEGSRFGLFGAKPEKPAATLFVFATALEDLHKSVFLDVGRRLAAHGYLIVSLDPPCHGADMVSGEP